MQFLSDEAVMQHAIAVARRGIGLVEPNPAVGAVVVDAERRLIAEGFHQRCGEAHAEVHAIAGAAGRTAGMRLFVTLEPCSHHGRTPPCTDSVVAAGFREVIIGCADPAAHTNGRGIRALQDAGIAVTAGICEHDARQLIAPFTMLHTQQRPWVHAKWAMTLDGRIATRTGHSQWISSDQSRAIVHQLRGRMDAIIVGAGTVRADNPTLTARPPGPRTATRVILDSTGEAVTLDSNLMRTLDEAPVLLVTGPRPHESACQALSNRGIETIALEADDAGTRPSIAGLLRELGMRQFTNVLVEGGADVLGSFFDRHLIDEVHVFIAPKLTGGSTSLGPLNGTGRAEIPSHPDLETVTIRRLEDDTYISGRIRR